mmetsp:Transcript_37703/g.70533  ORF Transcript_37703/g.70533 Transcript_37703/m.70533 type:complete len:219 (+) Transcript_37703:1517-2173(+)
MPLVPGGWKNHGHGVQPAQAQPWPGMALVSQSNALTPRPPASHHRLASQLQWPCKWYPSSCAQVISSAQVTPISGPGAQEMGPVKTPATASWATPPCSGSGTEATGISISISIQQNSPNALCSPQVVSTPCCDLGPKSEGAVVWECRTLMRSYGPRQGTSNQQLTPRLCVMVETTRPPFLEQIDGQRRRPLPLPLIAPGHQCPEIGHQAKDARGPPQH